MLPDRTAISSAIQRAGVADASVEVAAPLGMLARVPSAAVADVLLALRDGEEFSQLVDLFGMDTGEELEVTYHLRSFSRDHELFVRVAVPYDGEVPSVFDVFPAAMYNEREVAEMFGLTLLGHPNPKRLLTSDETDAFLLRKATPIRTEEEVRDRAW